MCCQALERVLGRFKDLLANLEGADLIMPPVSASSDVIPTTGRLTLTVVEAAEKLGVSRPTAYEMVRQGTMPGVIRVGNRILISKVAFDRFMNDAGDGN